MEQHPIPQQISSYEFRLVGNMTLKQFFKVAGGLVIAFIFYSSHLSFIIKWPLVLSFGLLGIALAFLPVNERPLEVWIFAFVKSVLSPTIYLWQKQLTTLDIFDTSFKEEEEEEEEEEEPIISKKPQLEEFLASLPKKQKKTDQKKEVTAPVQIQKPPERKTTITPRVEIDIPKTVVTPKPTIEAAFGEIPMPQPPTTPNIIVGMVTNQDGKIMEDVIIEIQDISENPVRALRTNQLGQFKTATPLANGEYLILAEKESYQFDIIKIKVEGKVISPLKITTKS